MLPKCEDISCGSLQFNPCTLAHDNELGPESFHRLQQVCSRQTRGSIFTMIRTYLPHTVLLGQFGWGNRSGYERWSADPANWFNCSQLDISHVQTRKQCSDHDGVAVRQPRLTGTRPLPPARSAPERALCAAMDAQARSAGFSWNFPASHHGVLHLRVPTLVNISV